MTDRSMSDGPIRMAFFGSGAFGLPTFKQLLALHDVAVVITQPDKPAGRKRVMTATPIGEHAQQTHVPILKPDNPNVPDAIAQIHAYNVDAFVVIAYGHKLSPALIGNHFAINLHASLLPKFRGAAPINWAMMSGESETGISVINLAQRMDAGVIFAQSRIAISESETAGELHDRLAELGVQPVLETLRHWQGDTLTPIQQDDSLASRAPKLAKQDGTVSFAGDAHAVRARVHGLTPWPGCTVQLAGAMVKLLRVKAEQLVHDAQPGTVLADGRIACADGAIRIIELQPPGKRPMTWDEYARGHTVALGGVCESV